MMCESFLQNWFSSDIKAHIQLTQSPECAQLNHEFTSVGFRKKAWYLLFVHALNYLTFPKFLDFSGHVWVMWRHLPISRTLNFTLAKWIGWFCTLLNTSAVLLHFERRTNSLCQGHLWRKGRISLPTGFGKSMCYEVLPLVSDDKLGRHHRTTSYWSSTKTTQERIHVERRTFTTICTYVALRYPHRFVLVRHRGPSHLTFT